MPARLVDLTVTEISLCRHGINPGARVVLVKGGDPPDPSADAIAKALAERDATIARLEAERAQAALVEKAASYRSLGVAPDDYAARMTALDAAAREWIDGILERAASVVAESDLYGERGRAALAKAEAPIVKRARAAAKRS
ncbi:MAG: hypothetical protein AB7O45_06300 [Alphaproteobacteria bacterium]